MIGYPEWVKSIGKLDKYYDGVSFLHKPPFRSASSLFFMHKVQILPSTKLQQLSTLQIISYKKSWENLTNKFLYS